MKMCSFCLILKHKKQERKFKRAINNEPGKTQIRTVIITI